MSFFIKQNAHTSTINAIPNNGDDFFFCFALFCCGVILCVDNVINEVSNRLVTVGSKVYSNTNGGQTGSNPFGFSGADFSNFNGGNFGDMFKNGFGTTNGSTQDTNKTEDVEEV